MCAGLFQWQLSFCFRSRCGFTGRVYLRCFRRVAVSPRLAANMPLKRLGATEHCAEVIWRCGAFYVAIPGAEAVMIRCHEACA